jgi:hypothetical protein
MSGKKNTQVDKAEMRRRKQQSSRDKKSRKAGSGKDQDYSIPAANATVSKNSRGAKIHQNRDGSTVIENRELFAGAVAGNGTFVTQAYLVNPGNPLLFPWLAGQAIGWQEYEFEELEFEYITRVGTSTVGSALMGMDYDAEATAPTSEVALAAYKGTVEFPPYTQRSVFRFDRAACSKILGPRRFILAGYTVADIKTYCIGQFFFGATEAASNVTWGKLFVRYRVRLSVPQTPFNGGGGLVFGGSVTGTAPLATDMLSGATVDPDSQGVALIAPVGAQITQLQLPRPGTWACTVVLQGTGLTSITIASAFVTASTFIGPVVGTTSTAIAVSYKLVAPNNPAPSFGRIQFTCAGTTFTAVNIIVSNLPPASLPMIVPRVVECRHCTDVTKCRKCNGPRCTTGDGVLL